MKKRSDELNIGKRLPEMGLLNQSAWFEVAVSGVETYRQSYGQDPLISAYGRDSRSQKRAVNMSDLFWLNDAPMARLEPFFPKSHALPGR